LTPALIVKCIAALHCTLVNQILANHRHDVSPHLLIASHSLTANIIVQARLIDQLLVEPVPKDSRCS